MGRFYQVDSVQTTINGSTVNVRAFDDDADGQEVGNMIVSTDWYGKKASTLFKSGRIDEKTAHKLAISKVKLNR